MTQKVCPDEVVNRSPCALEAEWYQGKAENLPEFISELHNDQELGQKAFEKSDYLKVEEERDTKKKIIGEVDLTYSQFHRLVEIAVEKPRHSYLPIDLLNQIMRVSSPKVAGRNQEGHLLLRNILDDPDTNFRLKGKSYAPPLWYVFGLAYVIDVWTGEKELRRCVYEKCNNIFHPTRADKRYCSDNCRKRSYELKNR